MSKLEQLIMELCPNGVEHKPLSEIANITRGIRVVRSQLATQGKYPVYQNSMTPLGYYEKSNCPANTSFIIAAGAAGEIGFSPIEFWAADDCFYFICSSNLQSRFLYYALLCRHNYILSRVRRASIPRLSRSVIDSLKIPVPPLPVQREIVRILDNFAELTVELTVELTARKKQYEYYRNLLLTFDDADATILDRQTRITDLRRAVKWFALNNVAVMKRGTYVTQKNTHPGDIPVILGGQEPAYYCDTSNHEGTAIVISRSGAYAGFVSYWNEPIFVTDGFIIEALDGVQIKYLYYFLKSKQGTLHNMKRGAGVPHVRGDEIMKLAIPVPPLEEQARIVAILDRFDALCNDITSGLPAEIEARRKQYEYYRDKLLTFKEKTT